MNLGKRILYSIIIILFAVGLVGIARQPVRQDTVDNTVDSRPLEFRQEVAARAYVWLDQIEGMSLGYDDVLTYMADVELDFDNMEDSYPNARQQAYEGLYQAYVTVVRERKAAGGYEGEISNDEVDQWMLAAYDVTVMEYLQQTVELVPAMEELEARYEK